MEGVEALDEASFRFATTPLGVFSFRYHCHRASLLSRALTFLTCVVACGRANEKTTLVRQPLSELPFPLRILVYCKMCV